MNIKGVKRKEIKWNFQFWTEQSISFYKGFCKYLWIGMGILSSYYKKQALKRVQSSFQSKEWTLAKKSKCMMHASFCYNFAHFFFSSKALKIEGVRPSFQCFATFFWADALQTMLSKKWPLLHTNLIWLVGWCQHWSALLASHDEL